MFKFIAHRANYDGCSVGENTIEKIKNCLGNGYDVEVDIRYENGRFLLGHDKGEHEVTYEFLFDNRDYLWIHCKDLTSFELLMNEDLNIFYHTDETVVLTTKGYVWTYPGQIQIKNSILVMPENIQSDIHVDINNIVGICSDDIEYYKNKIGDCLI